jgi:hypothetical protein
LKRDVAVLTTGKLEVKSDSEPNFAAEGPNCMIRELEIIF